MCVRVRALSDQREMKANNSIENGNKFIHFYWGEPKRWKIITIFEMSHVEMHLHSAPVYILRRRVYIEKFSVRRKYFEQKIHELNQHDSKKSTKYLQFHIVCGLRRTNTHTPPPPTHIRRHPRASIQPPHIIITHMYSYSKFTQIHMLLCMLLRWLRCRWSRQSVTPWKVTGKLFIKH